MLRFAFNLYVLGGPLPAPLKRASRLPRAVQPPPLPHSQRRQRCLRRRLAANASDVGLGLLRQQAASMWPGGGNGQSEREGRGEEGKVARPLQNMPTVLNAVAVAAAVAASASPLPLSLPPSCRWR